MARPKKIGLEYFPLDCQMDDKVEMLEAEHGLEGFAVYLKLLQAIYQTEAGELDMSVIFRWKTLGKQWGIPAENLRKIVDTMLEVALFDKTAFDEREVLTSGGIQKRISQVQKLRDRDNRRKTEGKPEFSDGKPAEKCTKGKGKDTTVSQKEKETEINSVLPPTPRGEGGEPSASFSTHAAEELPPVPAQRSGSAHQGGRAAAPAEQHPGPTGGQRDPKAFPPQLKLHFDSPAFRTAWITWRMYLIEKGRPFTGDISEQNALDRLHDISSGDEAKALKIIQETCANQWKNLTYNPPKHGNYPSAGVGGSRNANDASNRHQIPKRISYADDAA